MSESPTIHEALKTLRRTLPAAIKLLQLDLGETFTHWTQSLDRKLLPRMAPEFPLVAAICGGGSAGKSTLFNGLMQTSLSPSGGRAGINRRVLIGTHEDSSGNTLFLQALAHVPACQPSQQGRLARIAHPNQGATVAVGNSL